MENFQHNLKSLFTQLGLPDSDEQINYFFKTHRVLPQDMHLEDAPCWTPAQAALLRESIQEDAAWSDAVDELNVRLR